MALRGGGVTQVEIEVFEGGHVFRLPRPDRAARRRMLRDSRSLRYWPIRDPAMAELWCGAGYAVDLGLITISESYEIRWLAAILWVAEYDRRQVAQP